jgi:hypothetical protein
MCCGASFAPETSLSGFAQVVRREGPGPFGNISYGMWPVISGIIIIIFTCGAAMALMVNILIAS